MEPHWVAEHLLVIRTLMERSTVYRRALGPITALLGALALVAAAAGWMWRLETPAAFGGYWLAVCLVALAGAFVMTRREAIRDSEPFWSPPMRRVTHALLPALGVGAVASIILMVLAFRHPGPATILWWLLPVWMGLYGCALHAAGFFMPRGIRLFGWCFISAGCVLGTLLLLAPAFPAIRQAHLVMGGCFGGLHLGYAAYLRLTGRGNHES